ncbi:hypothetical protein AAH995_29040 [Pseudomonas putida]|uniref:hypothetical protein n=1 Tax=Pseudomonas putida TaxID=303 RepID=UPI00349F041D
MNELYKILIAAAVGFALSPITEIIKKSIETKQSRKKLIGKLDQALTTVNQAISTLNDTALKRSLYLNQRSLEVGIFILPYLRFPKIEDEYDKCYQELTKDEKDCISVAVHGIDHLIKLTEKIERHEVDLKNAQEGKTYKNELEIKMEMDSYYKRILSCEKAMIYTLISIRQNLKCALINQPNLKTDKEAFSSTAHELGIRFNLQWWPQLGLKNKTD